MTDKTVRPFSKLEEQIAEILIKPMSDLNTWIYRISGGKLGGRWLRGAPVMLLTTIGRKSGQPRTKPVLYLRNGDDVIVVASKGGMSRHPVWYLNVEANPNVEIEIGTEKTSMKARRATEEEKAALWPRLVEMYRDFDDYQARTERNIPVVVLSPR
jgi:deazaflavin-dependent oxidoreductase (nitroreductase family)